MVQEKITEVDTPTIWLVATPSGLISDPHPSFPPCYAGCLPAATLILYPGLGQALNMLACIPSGLGNKLFPKPLGKRYIFYGPDALFVTQPTE